MSEVLRRFVVDNIWCTPDQDYQSIYKPKKITRKNGVFKNVQTLRDRYRLPHDDIQYHVYQIGQVPPRLLGWEEGDYLKWISLSDLMDQYPLIVDAYTVSGQMLPRFATYVLWTPTKNLLVAVPRLEGYLDLNEEDVFVRFYTNAFYSSDRFTGSVDTFCHGQWIETEADRIQFQALYNTYKDLPTGAVRCVVDGRLIKVPSAMTVPVGSWAEFVYDGSVKDVLRVAYDTLKVFESELDGVRKYLLHLPKTIEGTIHYKDDLDITLWRKETDSLQIGTYYHQNKLSSVRMLTHQDYALPVSTVAQYTTDLPYWQDVSEIEVEVWVRHSGYERALTYEHNRIHELYKLPDEDIVSAMLGSLSAVSEWRAESLEMSSYPQMMRTGDPDSLSLTTIHNALGYNAITQVLCPNPIKVIDYLSERVAKRPPLCQGECLAIEYDGDGHLLHAERLTNNDTYYYVDSFEAEWVEFLPGPVGPNAQRFYDQEELTVSEEVCVHLYKCPTVGGMANGEWVLADEEDYTLTQNAGNKTYQWSINTQQWSTVFLTDAGVVVYGQDYNSDRDIVKLTLKVGVSRDGVWGFEVAEIPFDYLQLVMNGHSLVEGIDYTVKWPEVVIHTRQGLDTTKSTQSVRVITMGLPEDVMVYSPRKDVGFVVNGRLSDNHRFHVRDDRVNRVVVGGRLLDSSQVRFEEDGTLSEAPQFSGLPYSLRTPPLPIEPIDDRDRNDYLMASRDLDDRISQWMTSRYPSTVDGPSLFASKYDLVSPFLSSVLHDMLVGILDTSSVTVDMVTDTWLYDFLDGYLYLLDFDPAREDLNEHVSVHPHGQGTSVDVTRVQHTILVRANYLMLGQRAETHELLRVGA